MATGPVAPARDRTKATGSIAGSLVAQGRHVVTSPTVVPVASRVAEYGFGFQGNDGDGATFDLNMPKSTGCRVSHGL